MLPPIAEDPAIVAAQAAQASYVDAVQAARAQWGIPDLTKAEQVSTAYEALDAELTRLFDDLTTRRTARLTELEALVPLGTGIPADASPADRAVLTTTFRASFDRAQAAGYAERRTLLAQAERFDDDALRRAVLTVAVDEGQNDLIKEWCAIRGNGLPEAFAEGRALREALAGRGPDRGWVAQAFRRPRRPEELVALPGLRTLAARGQQQHDQAASRAANRRFAR